MVMYNLKNRVKSIQLLVELSFERKQKQILVELWGRGVHGSCTTQYVKTITVKFFYRIASLFLTAIEFQIHHVM